jgi:hypothetical protein
MLENVSKSLPILGCPRCKGIIATKPIAKSNQPDFEFDFLAKEINPNPTAVIPKQIKIYFKNVWFSICVSGAKKFSVIGTKGNNKSMIITIVRNVVFRIFIISRVLLSGSGRVK